MLHLARTMSISKRIVLPCFQVEKEQTSVSAERVRCLSVPAKKYSSSYVVCSYHAALCSCKLKCVQTYSGELLSSILSKRLSISNPHGCFNYVIRLIRLHLLMQVFLNLLPRRVSCIYLTGYCSSPPRKLCIAYLVSR